MVSRNKDVAGYKKRNGQCYSKDLNQLFTSLRVLFIIFSKTKLCRQINRMDTVMVQTQNDL